MLCLRIYYNLKYFDHNHSFFREISSPKILIVMIFCGLCYRFEFGGIFHLSTWKSGVILTIQVNFYSPDLLFFEFHFLIEKIFIPKKPVHNCFNIVHPFESNLHLQVFALNILLLFFDVTKTLCQLFDFSFIG